MSGNDRGVSDDRAFLMKIDEMVRAQEPIPPEMEERALEIHLKKEPERSDLLQRLCAVVAAQGRSIPLELEERALLAILVDDPGRQDVQTRLNAVQVALGKAEPPAPMVGPSGEQASETGVDFQEESRTYEEKANYEDLDPEFLPIMESVRQFSMTSIERMYAVYKSIEYLEKAAIPGAIVECGVWRGGSMMVALATLKALGQTDREIYLFDTFEGLPEPDADVDVDLFGNRAIDGWIPQSRGKKMSNWAYASLEDVKANIESVGYPMERVHFVKGMVEDTVPGTCPGSIALLRLDTDFYSSTVHEMKHLYPNLEKGGVLIIDDYGHFLGVRRAVDEHFEATGEAVLLQRIDYSGRLVVKT